jgi:uncharacterized coiled-coil protein SlyX
MQSESKARSTVCALLAGDIARMLWNSNTIEGVNVLTTPQQQQIERLRPLMESLSAKALQASEPGQGE